MISKDPCVIAAKVPRWLAEKKIADFTLSARVNQALQGASIWLVGDLATTSLAQLIAIPIGLQAMCELGDRLQRASEIGESCFQKEENVGLNHIKASSKSLKRDAILAVLNASSTPLHYKEIAKLATKIMGTRVAEAYVYHIGEEHWWVIESGFFALERHLPVGRATLLSVGAKAEDVVISGPADRQWHTLEILAALTELNPGLTDVFDEYLLDIALQKSKRLIWLRRMTWTAGDGNYLTSQAKVSGGRLRINQRQEMISILEKAGAPMAEAEILDHLRETRGSGFKNCIAPFEQMIRVGPRLWGLNDRDIVLKLSEQPALIDQLYVRLVKQGYAFYKSEIEPIAAEAGVAVETIYSLCQLDARFQTSVGHIFLGEWGDPRRATHLRATIAVLTNGRRRLTLEQIMDEVAVLTHRKTNKSTISSILSSIGAIKDERKLWRLD
jgi:hypothetical protein